MDSTNCSVISIYSFQCVPFLGFQPCVLCSKNHLLHSVYYILCLNTRWAFLWILLEIKYKLVCVVMSSSRNYVCQPEDHSDLLLQLLQLHLKLTKQHICYSTTKMRIAKIYKTLLSTAWTSACELISFATSITSDTWSTFLPPKAWNIVLLWGGTCSLCRDFS